MRRIGFLVALAAALASPVRAEIVNRIVASVDGDPITLYELDQFAAKVKEDTSREFENRQAALDALITEKLVAKEIEARNIVVRDADIDRYIERIKAENNVDEAQLKAALKQQGMEYDAYRKQIREEIQKAQLLNREIRGKVNVTPEDIHRYYEKNKETYRLPAKVQLRHIVLRLAPDAPEEIAKPVEERIAEVRKRIVEGGEDFGELAKQYSEDGAAASGGDLGELEPGQVLPEFAEAVAKLEDGQVSEPVRTSAGLHLIKLEKRVGEAFRPETEVAEEIKEKLYGEALDARYRHWLLEGIQKNHFIENKLAEAKLPSPAIAPPAPPAADAAAGEDEAAAPAGPEDAAAAPDTAAVEESAEAPPDPAAPTATEDAPASAAAGGEAKPAAAEAATAAGGEAKPAESAASAEPPREGERAAAAASAASAPAVPAEEPAPATTKGETAEPASDTGGEETAAAAAAPAASSAAPVEEAKVVERVEPRPAKAIERVEEAKPIERVEEAKTIERVQPEAAQAEGAGEAGDALTEEEKAAMPPSATAAGGADAAPEDGFDLDAAPEDDLGTAAEPAGASATEPDAG